MPQLPCRSQVACHLEQMLVNWHDFDGDGATRDGYGDLGRSDRPQHLPEPKPPAVYAIGVLDYRRLVDLDSEGTDRAIEEIAWRLDKLVRSGDVLGLSEPDTFLLAAGAIAPSSAGVVMERITGAIAMPLEIGGVPVSLRVAIGLAFAFDGASSEAMLAAAERDMQRLMGA